MKNKSIIAASVGLVSAVSFASAETKLHIDVNDITATASGVTAASTLTSQIASGYTGTISLSMQGSSSLADVAIVGSGTLAGFFDVGSSGVDALRAITGSITVVSNLVTGVGFSITAWDSALKLTSTTYSASITSGSGNLIHLGSGKIIVDGLTFAGLFTSSTYAGTDISAFTAVQPLMGNFLNFEMDLSGAAGIIRNESGIFDNSQLDVFVVIPLPATGGLAFAGLLGIGVIRRRR